MIAVSALINFVLGLKAQAANYDVARLVSDIVSTLLFPIVYGVVAALIISNTPRQGRGQGPNIIGWLLMTPAFFLSVGQPVNSYLSSFTIAPPATLPNLLMAWFDNWSWLLVILPFLLILLLFPTGRPPSPRWRWVLYLALGMGFILIFLVTFSPSFQAMNVNWKLSNPIALFSEGSEQFVNQYFLPPWMAGLVLLTLACFVSLFVRYRNAQAVEREQIKWLLFAGSLFVVVYIPTVVVVFMSEDDSWTGAADLFMFLTAMFLPIAIGIAILRYRLWDIDIIIRKTIIYTILTGILGLVYYGSVAVLQELLGRVSSVANLPVVIVISTLLIAALFSPVRRRVQQVIDRRFYRQKYNSQQILERFAGSVRNEVELDLLTTHLLDVVEETLNPESYTLWQMPARRRDGSNHPSK